MADGKEREYAAALGRRYFEGTLTIDALFEHFGTSTDPLVRALLVAIIHEPRKGFLGISESRWESEFWQPVSELLVELEKGEAGLAPKERVYPRVTRASFVGWGLFTLWAVAAAAENAWELWKDLARFDHLPYVRIGFRSLGLAVLLFASWTGLKALLHRLALYRTRHDPYGADGSW